MTDLSFLHNRSQLFAILGPCVVESRDSALHHADVIKTICDELKVPVIYKSSVEKANRTAHDSFRGVGIEKGLTILAEVKTQFELPLLIDVHEVAQVQQMADVADVLQVPAFLSRQTALLTACGLSGRWTNIKKGQFLAPQDMAHAAAKVRVSGSDKILLTERGTSFGYRELIVDMRSLEVMSAIGYPVVFDASHSCQSIGGNNGMSGGERRFIPALARAAVAVGVSGVFCEVHESPEHALSDSATQLPLSELKGLVQSLLRIREAV